MIDQRFIIIYASVCIVHPRQLFRCYFFLFFCRVKRWKAGNGYQDYKWNFHFLANSVECVVERRISRIWFGCFLRVCDPYSLIWAAVCPSLNHSSSVCHAFMGSLMLMGIVFFDSGKCEVPAVSEAWIWTNSYELRFCRNRNLWNWCWVSPQGSYLERDVVIGAVRWPDACSVKSEVRPMIWVNLTPPNRRIDLNGCWTSHLSEIGWPWIAFREVAFCW